MIETVVVALDGSEFAAAAIPVAAAITESDHAGIRLVGIARNDGEYAWMYDHVHDAAFRLAPRDEPEVDVIVDPDPAGVLLTISSDPKHVLCFATHDHRPLVTRLIDSVGSTVLERALNPLVLVGANVRAQATTGDVVVAVDGVHDPGRLLATAREWARQLHAPLRLVTVYEPVLEDLRRPGYFARHHGPSIDPDRYLDEISRAIEPDRVDAITTAAIADPVSVPAGLVRHLEEHPARVLVVGHRNGGGALPAGTVRELLRTAKVPLVFVNHPPRHAIV
jgi:hypothetical protein